MSKVIAFPKLLEPEGEFLLPPLVLRQLGELDEEDEPTPQCGPAKVIPFPEKKSDQP
jgi:hypothetical protein